MTKEKEQLKKQISTLKKRLNELERKSIESKKELDILKNEKEIIQKYIDISGAMLVSLDDKGDILFINKYGLRVLGYKNGSLIGKNWFDTCIPKDCRNKVKKVFEQLVEGNIKTVEYYENPILTRSGEERVVAWYNTVVLDAEGHITGCLSSGIDITEGKKAKNKLERAYQELKESHKMFIQAEKFAALGRFSSSVAHEIKNPLGIILGGTEYLESKMTDSNDPDIKKTLDAIKHAVHRGNNMVYNLLAYSRPSETRFERIECSDLIKSEIDFIKYGFIKKRIKIDTDLEKDVYIEGDKGQLQQALFNVMINAVDAMETKGRLKVKVCKKVLPEFSGSEPVCIIDISDNGAGISETNLSKIFYPFFTLKKGEKKGTGLGLSAVKTIVDNHEGKISVKSELKKGTSVRIILKTLK